MKKESQVQLETFIKSSESIISEEGLEAVNHYFEHGEYEMSFEGLVIELIKVKKYPYQFEFSKWEELALKYGLDKESVFSGCFWEKFISWGKRSLDRS